MLMYELITNLMKVILDFMKYDIIKNYEILAHRLESVHTLNISSLTLKA